MRHTYRRVCFVGCVGYSLCLFGYWFLSHKTNPYLLSLYILIHILLFILMASTFHDMSKILCAFKYYPCCLCIEQQDTVKHHDNIRSGIHTNSNSTLNVNCNGIKLQLHSCTQNSDNPTDTTNGNGNGNTKDSTSGKMDHNSNARGQPENENEKSTPFSRNKQWINNNDNNNNNNNHNSKQQLNMNRNMNRQMGLWHAESIHSKESTNNISINIDTYTRREQTHDGYDSAATNELQVGGSSHVYLPSPTATPVVVPVRLSPPPLHEDLVLSEEN